jgi:uncharacterized protein involved in exopolysaccharide biosynthesis
MQPIRGVGEVMARGWWAGVLVLVTTVVASSVLTSQQTPVFRSSAMVVTQPDPGLVETTEVLRSLEALERRTILATFSELAMSARVRGLAAERLDFAPETIRRYRITSSIVPNTNILRISAEGPDASGVALVAQAVAVVMGAEAQLLYRPFVVRPLSEAVVPRSPKLPDPRRNAIVAVVVGMFLGAGVAYAFGRLGRVRRTVSAHALEAHAAS